MPGLTTLPSDTTVEEAVAVIERDGGVIIENLFSGDVLSGLQRDIAAALSTTSFGVEDDFAGMKTKRAGAMFARSDHMVDVVTDPTFHGIAETLLCTPVPVWAGEHRVMVAPSLQVGVTQSIHITPGQGAQPLHRDDAAWLWRHPGFGREARVQIMVAISDFTEQNGATRVIPGSHRWDDEQAPKLADSVAAEMTAGSALIWIGSTYHGGGENVSDAPRTGLTASLDISILRQEENQYLSLPLERVRALPERVQRLLGWAGGEEYFLGWVELDGRMASPMELLANADYTDIGSVPRG